MSQKEGLHHAPCIFLAKFPIRHPSWASLCTLQLSGRLPLTTISVQHCFWAPCLLIRALFLPTFLNFFTFCLQTLSIQTYILLIIDPLRKIPPESTLLKGKGLCVTILSHHTLAYYECKLNSIHYLNSYC